MATTRENELKKGPVSTSYDRMSEIKAFDESKLGVQGLIENGVTKVPPMFHSSPHHHHHHLNDENSKLISIPTVDLKNHRDKVIREVQQACEDWGFFQVTNHGIPTHVLDEMINGTCRFHQQDPDLRKEYYSRDLERKVFYMSNYSLYKDPSVDWRDTLGFFMATHRPKDEELPQVCRDIVMEYSEKVKALASALLELLSEALGLKPSHLHEMGCDEGLLLLCHYYPPCPQPELTRGTSKHTDRDFITILLQDQLGGLQVLHQNQWIDVTPLHGALVINIGDLMQCSTQSFSKQFRTKNFSCILV